MKNLISGLFKSITSNSKSLFSAATKKAREVRASGKDFKEVAKDMSTNVTNNASELENLFFNNSTLGRTFTRQNTGGRIIGKIGSKIAGVGKGISNNKIINNPFTKFAARGLTSWKTAGVASFGVGLTYGAASAVLQRADERSNANRGGMPANNLATDGLTLSLSKRRHR